jgi:putative SOS response-associated peptidase YedK
MTRPGHSRWTLPAPWTAQNAAHRALENARAFSTSVHRPSSSGKDRRGEHQRRTCVSGRL